MGLVFGLKVGVGAKVRGAVSVEYRVGLDLGFGLG